MAVVLVLIAALVLLNAAFAGTELALVSLREGQLRRLEQRGEAGRRVARLARDPNDFLATLQVGITLAGFLASATAAVSLAPPLVGPLSSLGKAAEPVAVVVVTVMVSFVSLVLGELVPKRIALQRAERWALASSRPLSLISRLGRPVVWLLRRSTDLVVRLLGGDPEVRREDVSRDELRNLVAAQRGFSTEEREIIAGVLDVAERSLREVMVPRREVVAVQGGTPAEAALEALRTSGHSRAPVFTDDLDDVSGVVHLRDLVGAQGSASELARPAVALPETVGVLDALRQLQGQRQGMALVFNEYGGTEGIVTLEDLLEEIVGEIYDESDRDVREAHRGPDGSVVLAGSFPMHDLVDVGVQLPEGEYETVAGLVLDRLGHIPAPGEAVDVDEWNIKVLAVDGQSIARVRLAPPQGRRGPSQDEQVEEDEEQEAR